MSRRHKVCRFKRHRTYSTAELARAAGVCATTIYNWRREGLKPIDQQRPHVYAGARIIDFLTAKNKPRQPMSVGQIYCVACKAARTPADATAVLVGRSATTSDLRGICPSCSRTIYRRVRTSEAQEKAGDVNLRYEDDSVPISYGEVAPHTGVLEATA